MDNDEDIMDLSERNDDTPNLDKCVLYEYY